MKISNVHVAGTTFTDKDAVNSFGRDARTPEFNPSTVTLTPEPENTYDSNAIAVSYGDVRVGYLDAVNAAGITSLMSRRSLTTLGVSNVLCFHNDGNYGFWMDVNVS